MACGKASGTDAIPAGIYKEEGPTMIQRQTQLFQDMWKHASTVQRRHHSPHLQVEGISSVLRQPQRRLDVIHSWQDPDTCPAYHVILRLELLRIRLQDMFPDTEVLSRANLQSIPTLLQWVQVRWNGHTVRMNDNRLPKQLLYGDLTTSKRTAGGQKKRFKDSLKTSLKGPEIVSNYRRIAAEEKK
ncbi:hypothetical protein HOLleu_32829 [Holothuria leucospilota]|uniref:Uncharacterized protein n=1 Tax=Holothuria leucospilota TaxID=206669 RepID=A0A9Q1GZF2_HOLLE|nr:hypothetical protein HOLleu_32829 [Holothuria leucospilota]